MRDLILITQLHLIFIVVKRLLFCLALLFFTFTLFSQDDNLVPNPGFEERIECVYNDSSVQDAHPWYNPTDATPDVFHECAIVNTAPCQYPEPPLDPWLFGVPENAIGCETPNSGAGYGGFFAANPGVFPEFEFREYFAVRLTQPLAENETYFVRMALSLAERSTHSAWSISVGFSADSIYVEDFYAGHLDFSNNITWFSGEFINIRDGWQMIEMIYTASGGEEYICVGNFDSQEEVDLQQEVFEEDLTFPQWMNHFHESAYYYIDDVYVGQTPLSIVDNSNSSKIQIFPNPANDAISVKSVVPADFILYNSTGQVIQHSSEKLTHRRIDLRELPEGVYYLRLTSNNYSKTERVVVKH